MTDAAREHLPSRSIAKSVRIAGSAGLAAAAVQMLKARQVAADIGVELAPSSDQLFAYVSHETIAPSVAVELVNCIESTNPSPIVILAAAVTGTDQAAREQAAALAFLRSHGAVVTSDPDVWLESLVLLINYGLPAGPQVAMIAPPESWLAAQAQSPGFSAETRTWESVAAAQSALLSDGRSHATDIVLFECGTFDGVAQPELQRSSSDSLWVSVVARLESLQGQQIPSGTLVGARTAIAASMLVGAASQRLAAGVGAAPSSARFALNIDEQRVANQLDRIFESDVRLGDHETKALLSSYGVAITRQAVATTASSALRIAKRAGFPVEIKPWGPEVPSESDGCPVEIGLTTGADVRRGFAAVLTALGRSQNEDEGAAVIVREAAPQGRQLQATITQLPSLGWTVLVTGTGHAVPLAAPAPLRAIDAATLAMQLLASRASEAEPDRIALAELLQRASHLAVDCAARFTRVCLSRIVVGGRGERTLVVDAWIELRGA
jgi:hypothetical protein